MTQRTYIIRLMNDPNADLGTYYTLSVLDENKQQVHSFNSAYHHLILERIVDRQKSIDMNMSYILVDETILAEKPKKL